MCCNETKSNSCCQPHSHTHTHSDGTTHSHEHSHSHGHEHEHDHSHEGCCTGGHSHKDSGKCCQ